MPTSSLKRRHAFRTRLICRHVARRLLEVIGPLKLVHMDNTPTTRCGASHSMCANLTFIEQSISVLPNDFIALAGFPFNPSPIDDLNLAVLRIDQPGGLQLTDRF